MGTNAAYASSNSVLRLQLAMAASTGDLSERVWALASDAFMVLTIVSIFTFLWFWVLLDNHCMERHCPEGNSVGSSVAEYCIVASIFLYFLPYSWELLVRPPRVPAAAPCRLAARSAPPPAQGATQSNICVESGTAVAQKHAFACGAHGHATQQRPACGPLPVPCACARFSASCPVSCFARAWLAGVGAADVKRVALVRRVRRVVAARAVADGRCAPVAPQDTSLRLSEGPTVELVEK
jgi:hypothetical protein